MNPEVRNKIRSNILDVSDKFDMPDIIMNSYTRQFNAQMQLSATDVAYAVTSLLESPQTQDQNEKKQNSKVDGENQNPNSLMLQQQSDQKAKAGTGISDVHECLFDNFWIAYDALDLKQNNMNLLTKGIDLAKEMQEAIVRVGNGMIEKKEVKTS